ncbi:Hypothetical protein, putative [Bodo saltans]|uniref:CCDC81 HU domain-containing protein n=1 Tax=Bodo saltans TaxID=75058 RepID=A0A0S4IUB0_BODSA|nr:Hypothetical protein, putative [Bodo saltans]|eukprot:CUF96598.1 Hypothetical protein, putative [Bodo saltans]
MLSSRGALNTPTLLVECAAAQSKTSKKIFLLSEAEKVWNALGRVIRSQLMQNIPTQIPRLGAFWFDTKLLVTDGPLKYYQRVPKLGFHHTFTSTYALDDIQTPCENLKLTYERLPMDQITSISGVGAQTAALILNEVFLYLGESLFNGKVLNVDFPGAMNVVMKREKALITFDETLLEDLYAVDSRKWPLAVREMASIAKAACNSARPSSATSSRPRSASSSRPTTQPKTLEPRAAFVSSAQTGRLFVDIKNTPRLAPKKSPSTPQLRKGPLKAQPRLSSSLVQQPADEEEESVYEVLSPERHNMYARGNDEVFVVDERSPRREDPYHYYPNDNDALDDLQAVEDAPPVEETRAASAAPSSRSAGHRASSVRALLYGDDLPEQENQRNGRKRFNDRQPDHLAFMFTARQ